MAQRLDIGLDATADSTEGKRRADPDAALVEAIRSGDRAAFNQVVTKYQRPLYYLALRYLKNEADAADVAQRSFVRVYKSIGSFRGKSSFRTWLYRIAINLSLNHLRDHRREHASEIAEDALATDAIGAGRLQDAEQSRQLRAAIDQLPPKQRMVLELRIYDELPFKEVAALADCTENAAKVNFHHAMKRLRALLKESA